MPATMATERSQSAGHAQTHLHELKSPLDPYHRESERSMKMEQGMLPDAKDDHEHPAGEKPLKRFCCWQMSKRRRILAIGVSIMAVIVAILLIVMFVGGKAYAQKYANKVEISLNSIDLKYVEPNVDTHTIDVEFSVHMKHDGPLEARMDAAYARLEFGGKTFGKVKIPQQKLQSGKQEYDLVVRSDVDISDLAVLSSMSKALVDEAEVSLSAFAEVTVHAFGLTYSGIKVNRDLKLKGLQKFANPPPTLDAMKLNTCTDDAFKVLINATIDNISGFGLDGIGQLNMTVYYDKSYLGYAVSTHPERGLPRGNSTQEFEITIANTAAMKPTMLAMGLGIIGKRAQFYITGENPMATQVNMLKEAVRPINMSILYTDALEKVSFGPTCGIDKIVSF